MYRCWFAPGQKQIFPRSKLAPLRLPLARRVGEVCSKHVMHNTVHGDVAYINGGTNAYYEQVDNDNVYNTGNKRCMLMYCCISLNAPTVAATGPCIMYVFLHDDSVFLKLYIKCYPMFELSLIFGHKLSHSKFEIHVVMHLPQRRLQTRCQNVNSSGSNELMAVGGAQCERKTRKQRGSGQSCIVPL